MEKHPERNDPHRLIHVVSGGVAGAGIGFLSGYIALHVFLDVIDYIVGPFYVGNATAFLSMIAAALAGLQIGLSSGRFITGFLREAGTFASWLFLLAFILFTLLVSREGYLRGLLPIHW